MAEEEKDEEKEEETVYDEEGREELVDSGEMSPEEAGFMKGYEEANEEKKREERRGRRGRGERISLFWIFLRCFYIIEICLIRDYHPKFDL